MDPFLKQFARYLKQHYESNIDKLCIILPNKRGALFLKKYLASEFNKTFFLPVIISAEDFISELSGLQNLEGVDLLCKLYESYLAVYGEKAESFESFAKWGDLILQDFNEIDRYLVDAEDLYANLHSIKEIENWSLSGDELSEVQKNYLNFMKLIGAVYLDFTKRLTEANECYQGLGYRIALSKIENNPFINRFPKFIFCGFNALNKVETIIFSKLNNFGKADVIWDADTYYLDNDFQEAGLFLRKNFKNFPAKQHNFIGSYFKNKKQVEVISVPKQIGQAQVVNAVVAKWMNNGVPADKIAVVLANEKLLWPILKLLPDAVEHVNITMEYPIKYTPAYSFIELVLKIHLLFENQNTTRKHIYYSDFLNLLRHPFFTTYTNTLSLQKKNNEIIQLIIDKNYAFITHVLLKEIYEEDYNKLASVFEPWISSPVAVNELSKLLNVVQSTHLTSDLNNYKSTELEYLFVLIKNFNIINNYVVRYSYYQSLKALKVLLRQVIGSASAAFIGEPLKGIQIMGVLETRTLDFENIIFVSVNEGVLPSGKNQNSFIPNDLKRYFGMPLYSDKDAIYAYHFYRLLQRANNICITYDSETDAFGKGEKSRFVSQLMLELPVYNPEVKIKETVAIGKTSDVIYDDAIEIKKTNDSLELIYQKARANDLYNGLSPSSLITYKECSLKFYFRYGVGLKETESFEESAQANTFGSILHESLEHLYSPYINKLITDFDIKQISKKMPSVVETTFLNYFSKSEAFFGKNLLQQHVLKVYVEKLLSSDKDFITSLKKQNKELNILYLEKELSAAIEVEINGEKIPVYIKGKSDRIDRFGNTVRIIDYKSSISDKDDFNFSDFDKLFSDKKYDKMLQLFLYAWLVYKNNIAKPEEIKPCIIPFKKFLKQPQQLFLMKDVLIFSEKLFNEFEQHLTVFIESVFNTGEYFKQTENPDNCKYCAYKIICNKED